MKTARNPLPAICDGPQCLASPVPGQKFCRVHLKELGAREAEIASRAHRMLMQNVAAAKRDAARWEMKERGLATVYAVRAADAVKFGHTCTDVDKRVRALQTGCPVDLELLGHTLCDSIMEGAIHYYLKPHCHLRGEWFRLGHPEVQEVIALIRTHQADKLLKLVAPEYFRAFKAPLVDCVSVDKG